MVTFFAHSFRIECLINVRTGSNKFLMFFSDLFFFPLLGNAMLCRTMASPNNTGTQGFL